MRRAEEPAASDRRLDAGGAGETQRQASEEGDVYAVEEVPLIRPMARRTSPLMGSPRIVGLAHVC